MEHPMNSDGPRQEEAAGIQNEPIAIVGMGCRLPGHVSSPSDLWEFLIQNKSGNCAVPESRYNADGFYHPNAERPGSINSKGGYFIQEDIRSFENAFFGINNLEATYMDAQQRKLLEVVFESFENAGVPLSQIQGSNTGVYVGNFTNDYMIMQYAEPEYFSRYSATGSGPTVLSNRITHCFDLRGPSVVMDTACSSSMYALHFACLALDARDCDAAVVASANLIQSAEQQLIAVKAGILSPDATCHTFDEAANGYGRADGASSLYLKRLSDAQRDGDPIRCVIRGTAINGNGRTPGIVQPSIDGQEAVIRAAYRRARLPTDETDYVEAHGTGTKVGDPIELEGISRVFRHRTGIKTPVGGIKPNLGHSEGASGISSVIKLALALERGTIPATIGVKNINPSIKLDEWHLDIVRENRPWPSSRIARASVNSFGFGGANGHAILEAAPPVYSSSDALIPNGDNKQIMGLQDDDNNSAALITFSARTEYSLEKQIEGVAKYVDDNSESARLKLHDLLYTLNSRRSRLAKRAFAVITPQTLKEDIQLSNIVQCKFTTPNQSATGGSTRPLVFVFTGQGAQWPGMGSQLFHQYTTFRNSIRSLDSYLADPDFKAGKPSWKIEDTLLAAANGEAGSDVDLAKKSQPMCTAIQIALVDLLKEWGITPKACVGHSSGEIGVAYASGRLSAGQAITAAYLRGLAVSCRAQKGSMMAVGLGKDAARNLINENGLSEQVTLACENSPESCTLSGDSSGIERLLDALQGKGTFARVLKTDDKAYHSKHMGEVGPYYQDWLEREWYEWSSVGQPKVNGHETRVISSVSGKEVTSAEMSTPGYWRANLESPVKFHDAVKEVLGLDLGGQGCHFVEIGPHSALQLPIKQIVIASKSELDWEQQFAYDSALVRGKDASRTVLSLVGSLFLQGFDHFPLEDVLPDSLMSSPPQQKQRHVLTNLPPYTWDYTAAPLLWTEPRSVSEFRNRLFSRHELLGSQIPGASKVTTLWRNIVDVNEVSWLKDHCLGPSIVFPAAAYLAMGVEAVTQVNGIRLLDDCPGVEMRDFNFLKTMDFHPEQLPRLEVITEMRKARVSSVISSGGWWEFTVSSIRDEKSPPVIHVTGLVSLNEAPKTAPNALPRTINLDKRTMEKQATRAWYDKFTKEGLNWGPQFAVMEDIYCDPARQTHESLATTRLLRGGDVGESGLPCQYIAHPISIDSMLQGAFVATTGGWVRDLRATVPVKMDTISFSAPSLLDMDITQQWNIDSRSERVGFGTVNIEAELYNTSGEVLIRMAGARCIAYQGNVQHKETTEQRNPMCRVAWKPDVAFLAHGADAAFTEYLDWFSNAHSGNNTVSRAIVRLAGALDLCAHKNPKAHVLVIGADQDAIEFLLGVLHANSPLRAFETFTQAKFRGGELYGRQISFDASQNDTVDKAIPGEANYDFDIIVNLDSSSAWYIRSWVPNNTLLITPYSFDTNEFVEFCAPFWNMSATGDAEGFVYINRAWLLSEQPEKPKCEIVMVNDTAFLSEIDSKIHKEMETYFDRSIPIIGLSQANDKTVPSRAIVISTIESDRPMISRCTKDEMRQLKTLTDRASLVLWICNAGFMAGKSPELAPVLGLSRAIMLEQPSLRFSVFDIGDEAAIHPGTTACNTARVMDQLLSDPNAAELELCQRDQSIHSVRWEPVDELNERFRLKQDGDLLEMSVEKAGHCQLSITQPGQLDTIHFISQEKSLLQPLPAAYVEIEVKSVGMNAKDLYVLNAKVDTRNVSCSCECAGIVVAVGTGVVDLAPGDHVVAMAPGHFATHERLPRWAVCKLQGDEDFVTASTVPIVFSTAIYGLVNRADLQPDESVLIHSAAGGVGIAAIQLAKHIGATIFATVGNDTKKEFLVKEFDLNPAHIFSSRDDSFLRGVMKATDGRGVDVVLNSLTGELLRSSLDACASFGRFVEIGKRDILDHGSLDMAAFGRNVSFTAFDLSELFYSDKRSHHILWQKLLTASMKLIRDGVAKPCSPVQVFKASEITQAFRYFSLGTRMGKVAVSFEDKGDCIRVKPPRFTTTFSPLKTYLMVGCLGGLGRSISRWMVLRGARSFVFLGRSGLAKTEARELVKDLAKRGAHVSVVQGDVSKYEDVEMMMRKAPLPIGGVIQAAMNLSEALWSTMSHASWHACLAPKIQGTWNLHNALERNDHESQLDFFLVTSSISGTVGTATESNYCAANAFLDAFARHRVQQGRPAVSVGYGMISEVGYLHEHPDIEALLKRKGIHSINEDELLQILDLALTTGKSALSTPLSSTHYDGLSTAHILTGIEFTGLKAQRDRGFEGDNHVLKDPRASRLAAAFARSSRDSAGSGNSNPHHKNLPADLMAALSSSSSSTATLLDAVQSIVSRKISNLILLPQDQQLGPDQELGEFGIDSMLAAEFRTAIFHGLGVDVPFVMLLDKRTSVGGLAKVIVEELEGRANE